MTLKPEEVSWIIQHEIEDYKEKLQYESIGRILQIGDGIARIFGLDDVMLSELIEFPNGTLGMVLNLETDHVAAILFGSDDGLKEHDIVKRTYKLASIPVGEALLGRVVNPLGVPLDDKGPIQTQFSRPLEFNAPSVVQRKPVHEPIETGIKAIDCMVPIGKGQRELIIGDRQTGKTALILDTIINQKNKGVYCIYVAIGQKASNIFQIVNTLKMHEALDYTIVVAAMASDQASLQYIAPYSGTALGEYFMYGKKHAICFYDDLSKHAVSYRQLALLLKRPAGREAYPGDIFYLHSRLLERAGKLNDALGAGSLTAIPVIETQANDLTTYIPTNIISITDGQIFLESALFHAGIRPAINVGISVSRVGGKAQPNIIRQVAGSLRLDLAQFIELSAFAQFKSELDETTQAQITRGERLRQMLNQNRFCPLSKEKQAIIVHAGVKGYLDDIPLERIAAFETQLLDYIEKKHPDMMCAICESDTLDQPMSHQLELAITTFKKEFN